MHIDSVACRVTALGRRHSTALQADCGAGENEQTTMMCADTLTRAGNSMMIAGAANVEYISIQGASRSTRLYPPPPPPPSLSLAHSGHTARSSLSKSLTGCSPTSTSTHTHPPAPRAGRDTPARKFPLIHAKMLEDVDIGRLARRRLWQRVLSHVAHPSNTSDLCGPAAALDESQAPDLTRALFRRPVDSARTRKLDAPAKASSGSLVPSPDPRKLDGPLALRSRLF